jgi:PAS domain S-box-containing protein
MDVNSNYLPDGEEQHNKPAPVPQLDLDFHAALLDSIHEAVVCVDSDFKIVYLNRAAETMFGWFRQEIGGRAVSELLIHQLSQDQRESILKDLLEGRHVELELPLQRKDGIIFWAEATGTALNISDRFQGYVFTLEDCTNRRQLELNLEQAHQQLTFNGSTSSRPFLNPLTTPCSFTIPTTG